MPQSAPLPAVRSSIARAMHEKSSVASDPAPLNQAQTHREPAMKGHRDVCVTFCFARSFLRVDRGPMNRSRTSISRSCCWYGHADPDRPHGKFGASVLVEAAGQPYVFDCGRGCGIRLAQVYGAADYRRVDTVFISHHHGDHTVGLPEVLVSNWQARRGRPFRVWGPPYTAQLMSHLALAYAGDVALRGGDGAADAAPLQSQVTELTRDGIILEENGVTVTAFLVDHSPVEPAFGYRLDYNGRSVVISGDTLPSDNLAPHAMGVDLLIHGVMSPASADYLRESMPDNSRRADTSFRVTHRLRERARCSLGHGLE